MLLGDTKPDSEPWSMVAPAYNNAEETPYLKYPVASQFVLRKKAAKSGHDPT